MCQRRLCYSFILYILGGHKASVNTCEVHIGWVLKAGQLEARVEMMGVTEGLQVIGGFKYFLIDNRLKELSYNLKIQNQ